MSHELNGMSPTEPSIPSSHFGENDSTIGKKQPIPGEVYKDQLSQGIPTQQKLHTPSSNFVYDILADIPELERPLAAEEIISESAAKAKQIDQVLLNKQRKNAILNHAVTILEDHYEVAKQNPQIAAKNEGEEQSMNYLEAVFSALKSTKETLRHSQIEDAQTGKKTSDYKIVETEKRRVLADQELEHMEKIGKWQDALGVLGTAIKWISPVLAAVCLVATIVSFGAAAPFLVAAFALLAYSVVDSIFGVTEKVMTGVNDLIANVIPDSSFAQAAVKVLVVAVAVAMIVATVAMGNAGAAANIGSQFVKQAVKFASQALKPIAMQAVAMVITASNAIPELAGRFVELFAGEKGGNIVQSIVVIMQLIAITLSMILMGKGSKPAVNPQPKMNPIDKVKEMADALLQKIKDLPNDIKETTVGAIQSLKRLFELSAGPSNVIKGVQSMDIPKRLLFGMQLLTISVDAAASSASGLMNLYVAKLYNELGDMKSADELLAGYQKSMDQLINTIYTGIEQAGQSAETVQDDLNSLIFGFGQSVQNISSYRG